MTVKVLLIFLMTPIGEEDLSFFYEVQDIYKTIHYVVGLDLVLPT